jgi:hypothetical protein
MQNTEFRIRESEMADEQSGSSLMDELQEERRKREGLEQRVNELVAENARSKAAAEDAERGSRIRTELQKAGIAKVDLAFRAVKDELAKSSIEEIRQHIAKFAAENPELMPARIAGGSGAVASSKQSGMGGGVDLDKIRPGMSAEEMERVRQEIARVASQTLRGGW